MLRYKLLKYDATINLGSGFLGVVHEGKFKDTNVAIKILPENLSEAISEVFENDISSYITNISNPNIIRIIG